MAILTLEEAISHCRVDASYPVEQLLPYMAGAENYVTAHLNRAVFADEAALTEEQDGIATVIGAASDARKAALEAAAQVENADERQAMIDLAEARYANAQLAATRIMNGIVADGSVRAAMLLTLGNLFANRETDVVGATVAALPTGVPELLQPYRLVQMP